MKFLSKYWWVIVLLVGAVVAYWWFMKGDNKKPELQKTPTCKKVTQTEFDVVVDEYVAAINDPANTQWKDDINAKKDPNDTLDLAIEKNAIWMVENSDKLCVSATA